MYDQLTQKDVDMMKEEIEHRILVVRKQALEDVKVARAHGDLSENFEYKAAKQFKNENEKRIRYLQNMVKTAVIIEDESKDDEVGLYKTVTLFFEDEEEEETYQIVTSVRGSIHTGCIAHESPVAKAIMGHKTGERVYVQVSDDYDYYVVIKNIENTSDDGSIELKQF